MATTREKAERLLAQIGLASQHQTSDDFMGIAEICQAYLNPWISVENPPDDNVPVLVKVNVIERFGPIEHVEIMTGWRTFDGEGDKVWALGNNTILWDYEYNIDYIDILEWAHLPPNPPKE